MATTPDSPTKQYPIRTRLQDGRIVRTDYTPGEPLPYRTYIEGEEGDARTNGEGQADVDHDVTVAEEPGGWEGATSL